mgnify:CR=1 FL=1
MEDVRSGYRNTAIGWESLRNINSGYENVCVGYEAGRTISTGNENILIGASAAPSSTTVSREMFIGNGTSGNGANTFYVHSTSGAYNGTNNQHWNQTSDQRIKKNITNFDTGLEVINQLQVRNFEYKTKDEIKSDNPELTDALSSMENVLDISGVQKGLIAQEAGIIKNIYEKSDRNKLLSQNNIFCKDTLKELITKTLPEFKIQKCESFFIKPFTHNQMMECIDQKIVNEKVIDGLYESTKYLPELGCELYCIISKL